MPLRLLPSPSQVLWALGAVWALSLSGCAWPPQSVPPGAPLSESLDAPAKADSAVKPVSAEIPVSLREILAKEAWGRRPESVQPDATPGVLRWQYEALEDMLAQPEAHRPDLRPLLRDPQPVVAVNAAIGLARLGDATAAPRLAEVVRIPTLKLASRCAAIEALAGLEHPPRVDLLRELLQQYGQVQANQPSRYIPELHAELLHGLARHAEEADRAVLVAALRSPAAEVRREGLWALAALPGDRLPVEAADLRTDPEARVRATCLTILARQRTPEAQEYLSAALDDSDLHVRLAAVAALGTLASDDARKRLRAELGNSSELIRAAVVSALAAAGDRQAVLETARDKFGRVRLAVAKGLAHFPDAESAAVLQKYLTDPSIPVEQQAIATLGQWPLELGGPLLLEAMAGNVYTARKASAAQLAQRWPAAARFSPDAPPERRSEILEQLGHEFRQQFGAAGTPASSSGVTPETLARVQALLEQLSRTAASEVSREQVVAEFQQMGPSGVDALEELVFVRHQLLPAAVYRHLLPPVDPVFQALDRMASEDVQVRRRAASDLAEQASRRPLRRLAVARLAEQAASESDALVWQSLLTALNSNSSEAAVRLAAIALGQPSPEVRRRACEYLEAHPAAGHAALLLPLLQDRHDEVTAAAARALGVLGHLDDPAPLRQKLASNSAAVQLEVAIALARLGDEAGVAALERLSYSGEETIRRRVALAMGEQPSGSYLPILIRLLDDKKQSVRVAALGALPRLVGQDVTARPGQPPPPMAERMEQWKRWYQDQQRKG